jgi:hypothetical protein
LAEAWKESEKEKPALPELREAAVAMEEESQEDLVAV